MLLLAVVGAVFFALPVYAQNAGVIIAEQLDQSGDVAGNLTPVINATSSDGFIGYAPTYVHLRVLNTSGTDTIGNGTNLHFFSDTGCSLNEQLFQVPATVIPTSASVQDVYMDLTNPDAFATSTVKCIQVTGLFSQFPSNTRVYTNAAHTLAFFELAATFAPFPSGSFSIVTGAPTTTSAFGTNATSSAACDAIGSDPVGLAWALCTTAAYLFVPAPDILNGYANLPTLAESKFPFSWFFGLKETVDELTATTTTNMAEVTIGFAGVDPATSTPFGNILPNVTILSSTTITQFLSPTMLATFLFLEASALWVIVGFFIYERIRHKWLHQ